MQKKLPVYYPENDLGICFTHTGFLLHPRFKEVRERFSSQFIESFAIKNNSFFLFNINLAFAMGLFGLSYPRIFKSQATFSGAEMKQ